MGTLYAKHALLPDGWAEDVLITWDRAGWISSVARNTAKPPPEAETAPGPVLPGLVNLHSHAFQRAMAGRGEVMGSREDSFWSWREVMYGLALTLGPEDLAVIARQLAIECLKGGFTGICEFHYLHRAPDGGDYDDPALLSKAVVGAYREAGIGVTHLPVLYKTGGFGDAPLGERQRRFRSDASFVIETGVAVRAAHAGDADLSIGIAPHSLRAAPVGEIACALAALDREAPVHIHISEQVKEVEDCLVAHGARPIAMLYDGLDEIPDGRWCLVHATHPDAAELRMMAESGAVVGLCPMTEGNLGDGLFPVEGFREQGGRWGIGTDSHVSRDAAEELRILEYGQRLVTRRRNVVADEESPHVGATLWREAARGGAKAAGRATGRIEIGARADMIALDGFAPDLAGLANDQLLDVYVFSGAPGLVRDVHVGGRKVLNEGRHAMEEESAAAFRGLLRRL